MFIKRCNVQVNVIDTNKKSSVETNFTDEEIKESIKKAVEQINKFKSSEKK